MLKNGDNLSGQIEKHVGDVASCTKQSKTISLGCGARDLGHARTSVCAFARALPETSPFCARGRSRAALAHLKFRVRAQQRAGARVRARRRARPSWRLAYSIGRLALPSVRLVSEADGRGRNASRCPMASSNHKFSLPAPRLQTVAQRAGSACALARTSMLGPSTI